MKKKVLIVDDKKEMQKMLSIYLGRNFEVRVANNASEALLIMHKGLMPDIILSDINMPELDGYGFVDQLKSSGFFKNIPVIMVTSEDDSAKRIELLKKGISDYLIKPFNPEELAVRVSNALTLRETQQNIIYAKAI